MDRSQPTPRAARFGLFEADFEQRALTKGGLRIKIQDQPFQVLAMLLDRPGELVTREEIRRRLWPADTFVEFDDGLNTAIKKLRAALNDFADNPRFIETVPRRGYRFLAPVTTQASVHQAEAAETKETSPSYFVGRPSTQEIASTETTSEALLRPTPPTRQMPLTAMMALTATAAIVIAFGFATRNGARAAHPLRAVITLPSELRLITRGESLGLAVSPDGTQVVFTAVGPENHPQLWLRRLDSLTPEPIPGTEDGAFPFWSPDGKSFGFFAGYELKRENLADHSVSTLCPIESARGGTWSNDGVILFSPDTRSSIYKVSAEGGTPTAVTILDESRYSTHRWPEFLPDGKHFVYLAANHDKSGMPGALFLGSLEGEPAKFLVESDSNAAAVPGSLLFLSHGKLMSQFLDLENGAVDSRANIIAEGVNYDPGTWYGSFAATSVEVIYRPRQKKREDNTIAWYDRKGNKLATAGPPGIYREVSLAPDGKTIATACGDPEVNVCLIRSDGTVTQVTGGGINGGPTWASNSTLFSYYMHRGNADYAIAIKSLDEKTPGHVVLRGTNNDALLCWHPDNRHALLSRYMGHGTGAYFIFDLATNKMIPYLSPALGMTDFARFSPDGNWVAYSKLSNGKTQLHIASYPWPSLNYTVNELVGRSPKWRGDGRELYFLGPGDNLYAVPVSADGGRLSFGTPQLLFHPAMPPAPWDIASFDVSRDGTRFLVNTVATGEPSQLVLTTNWQR